jgi:hypothetical protein
LYGNISENAALKTEYIKAGAELSQVEQRISPLKNRQGQYQDSADIRYDEYAGGAAAGYARSRQQNCANRDCYDDLKKDVQCEAGFIRREDC